MNEKYGFGTKRLADLVGDLGLPFERDYTNNGQVISESRCNKECNNGK